MKTNTQEIGSGMAEIKLFGKVIEPVEVKRRRNYLYQRKFHLKSRIAQIESGLIEPRTGSKDVDALKKQLAQTIGLMKQLSGNGRGRPRKNAEA